MRFWPVLASLALVTAAAPRFALADINGGTVELVVKIPEDETKLGSTTVTDFMSVGDLDLRRYFNKAHCQCGKIENAPDINVLIEHQWKMGTMPTSTPDQTLYAWVGTSCPMQMASERPNVCLALDNVEASQLMSVVPKFYPVAKLIAPKSTTCDGDVTTSYSVSTSADGGGVLTEQASRAFVTAMMSADLKAPPVPTAVTVASLEQAVKLSWSAPDTTDIDQYQLLCATSAGLPVKTGAEDREFDTIMDLCEQPAPDLTAATISNPGQYDGDAMVATNEIKGSLFTLGKSFVCATESGTSTSISVTGLENGKDYWVALVAIDKAGNYSAVYVPSTIRPKPVDDFWEVINEQDGQVEGGFCLLETTFGGGHGGGPGGLYGALRAWRDELRTSAGGRWMVERYYAWGAPLADAARTSVVVRVLLAVALLPVIAIALAWHALTLPGLLALVAAITLWRRRRRALVVAAAALLTPSLAAAQSYSPYWDESEPASTSRVSDSGFHLGFRIGPYQPSIDEKFGAAKPYESTFDKGKGVLPMVGLHKLWTLSFGQLGVGVAGGYFGKDAPSYLPDQTDPLPDRDRSVDNRTYFRLIPLELTGVFRATTIDDVWGIPLVPYVRGGLGYYVWWMRRPDGKISEVCPMDATGMVTGECDRARGASLGLVGAAGLSIRAERIDEESARSMRDSGIEHAGFFAEISTAWVDGFGSDKKLSLGDTTYFGGIDFEF